jgi:flagellar biosynthesis/type III secretory pathway protein FliH
LQEGFREGQSAAADKIFQNSFDNGYQDGFKMGFLLGKSKKDQAKLGRCDMCRDSSLLKSKTEADVREIARRSFDKETTGT